MPDLTIHIPDDKLEALAAAIGCPGDGRERAVIDCITEVTNWLTNVARDRLWSAERVVAAAAASDAVPNPIPEA